MLFTYLSAVRDHEGFLWRGRLGSLYVKLGKPTLSAVWMRELAPDTYDGRLLGFHLGYLAERIAYGFKLWLRYWSVELCLGEYGFLHAFGRTWQFGGAP